VDEHDLADLLHEHAARHAVPGAALGIVREGTVMTAYHGVTDVTSGDPVTPGTRFSIGSLTKPMVATVIAGLAEAGRLSLDDSVAAHVPELRGGRWAEGATVRDLLANRSALPLRADLEFGFAGHGEDDLALARLAAEVGQSVPMAAIWSYTNVGWCLLGRMIETLTGNTWEHAMRLHLFERLDMSGTAFATDRDPTRRVAGHKITDGGAVRLEPTVARAYGPAGTSVISTVTDLLRFAAHHVEEVSLASLRVPHSDIAIHSWLDSWGLGWAQFDWAGGGGEVWGWDGLIGGERSFLRIVPDQDAAVVLMTNASTGRAMYRSLFPVLMEAVAEIRVPPLGLDVSPGAAGDLSRFAGVYAWPDRNVVVTTTTRGLLFDDEVGRSEGLPLDERTFLVDASDPDNPTVTFGGFDAAGRPRVLYLMLWGLPRVDAGFD
jgi:CubicO group peptidase (beta-lactamase class C family)